MLGLRHGENRLVAYSTSWPLEFDAERKRLGVALAGRIEQIEHFGSTSVPGLPAKPVLDILVGVLPLDNWATCHDPLVDLGYDYAEAAGVPGHYIFGKGRDRTERTYLVHVVEFEGPSWRSNLAFRDALRTDAALRAAYLKVKETAMAEAPSGRAKYNALKAAFIDAEKAKLEW